ncbi:histidine phosphatase family protein [Brevibacterium otitidis]|uniref:Histidine phosphatase family protein n=1 Tax=Brevibacterium otitidis TaxID=53364 RepID=A0ABV5X0U4_9MICO|nr:hypothetical protein GCM10023233_28490 [Brevibacterium otitidis]BFF08663.1 hypothetical protein GCM10023233_36320 [Brevibacterium otitidis]
MSSFLGRTLGAALLTRGTDCLDVFLIRHGQQTRPGPDTPEAASYDPPLSAIGRAQAEAAADALAARPITAVYASQLARAHDTAAAIAARHRLGVGTDERLAEVGIFQQVPAHLSFEQAVGAQTAAEAAETMVRTRKWDALPLGEGSQAFRTRVHTAIWELARQHLPEPGSAMRAREAAERSGEPVPHPQAIAIACHGGVINAFLAEEYGLEADFLFRPAHAGITRVRFAADRAVMLTGNELGHLEDRQLLTF